jgi:hypothetical protein
MLPPLLLPCSLVVTPLCAKLSSQDPAVAAAARSEAVAAALAATKSGLPKQLHYHTFLLNAGLHEVMEKKLRPAEASLRKTLANAVRHVEGLGWCSREL